VYVDDIIFGSNNNSLCEELIATMKGEFEMSMVMSVYEQGSNQIQSNHITKLQKGFSSI